MVATKQGALAPIEVVQSHLTSLCGLTTPLIIDIELLLEEKNRQALPHSTAQLLRSPHGNPRCTDTPITGTSIFPSRRKLITTL